MIQNSTHTDIVTHGWIAHLPSSWQSYVLLARLDRPIGTWLLFLPGAWAICLVAERASYIHTLWLLALFAIGSIVMRSAGCVVNDMWDRDIDRQVSRTANRPLASGRIRMRQAGLFLVVLLLIGALILLQLNRPAQYLGVSSLFLVALYPLAKRYTWWPQLIMGFTFGFGAPLGYTAATGRFDGLQLTLYVATIVWQLGFDTIYGFQDMEDDARIGVKSTSRRWASHARAFVGTCYALFAILLLLVGYFSHMHMPYWLALSIPFFLLVRQIWMLNIYNPALCLLQFKEHKTIGMLIILAIILGKCPTL